MSIGGRLVAATMTGMLLVAVVVGTAIGLTWRASSTITTGGAEADAVQVMTHAVQQSATDVIGYLATDNLALRVDYEEHASQLERALSSLNFVSGNAADRAPGEKELLAALPARVTAFSRASGVLMAQQPGVAPAKSAVTGYVQASQALGQDLTDLSALERAEATAALKSARRQMDILGWALVVAGLLAMTGAAVVGAMSYRAIKRPVDQLRDATEAFARGELDYPVDTSAKGEIGDLARSFAEMRDSLTVASAEVEAENLRRAEAQSRLEAAMSEAAAINAELAEEARERRRADQELVAANDQLSTQLVEVATVQNEMSILAEMGAMLQSDVTSAEAYAIVGRYAEAVMPGTSGGLYAMANSRNMLDVVASWGEGMPTAEYFSPGDCWALRLGRAHAPGEEHVATDCAHVNGDDTGDYLCVPLSAQGDSIGVLVVYHVDVLAHPGDSREEAVARTHRLAITFAEQVALAVSNLRLRETLREQSIRDSLTGLYNRRYMEDSLEREVTRARRHGHPLAVVMLDLDHFKEYNDDAGHGAGDAALAAVGRFLRESTRADDFACRYGGEEFLLLWPTMTLDGAVRRADDLRQGIRELAVREGERTLPGVTVSIGVTVLGSGADEDADSAVRRADNALYRAKNGGRDRVMSEPAPEGVPRAEEAGPPSADHLRRAGGPHAA